MKQPHLFWDFTKDFLLRIEAPTCIGACLSEKNLFQYEGRAGSLEEGNIVVLHWMVDEQGMVLDALFQAFGDTVLIGCAEMACEMSIRKPYEQVLLYIPKQLSEKISKADIPLRAQRSVSLVLEALEQLSRSVKSTEKQYPDWDIVPREERLLMVREAVERYIAPYLRRDGGDITVVDITADNKVTITFHGACVECAAFGSTLSYIQHTLKHKVHPSIEVR